MAETIEMVIERVPDAETVRHRLGKAIRDVKLLRHLLRVAERIEREQRTERSVQNVAH